jgi:hypothetical protein
MPPTLYASQITNCISVDITLLLTTNTDQKWKQEVHLSLYHFSGYFNKLSFFCVNLKTKMVVTVVLTLDHIGNNFVCELETQISHVLQLEATTIFDL